MANHFIISIDSLISTFSIVESGKEIQFSIVTENTNLKNQIIAVGDKIVATISDKVYYSFIVIGVEIDKIKLRKIFEIEKSIKYPIQSVGEFISISEENYDIICSKLFNDYFDSKNEIEVKSEIDLKDLKAEFAEWLFKQGKYKRVYKSDKTILIEKLSEFENAYEIDFGIGIFDYPNLSISEIIKELELNTIDESGAIGELNKKTVGNGSVKAMLGPNNYIKFLKEINNQSQVTTTKISEKEQVVFDISVFQKQCLNAGLIFSPQLIQRFVASLCTKPFVICSGLSGSGKTKLSQAFAQWISVDKSQYEIVPVGADWTNREPLLGYPNALNKEEYVMPENGVLSLMMKAKDEYDIYLADQTKIPKPYFLILDEMNLSHVERYFADFLSTMESGDKIPLHKIDGGANGVPGKIQLPKNLFIIGTVNIDETTYMFSPKVLDRANTIEFRVSEDDLKKYIASDITLNIDLLTSKGANMSDSFMQMALQKTDKNLKPSEKALTDFFTELKKAGAEFGYRTASEIGRLMFILEQLDEKGDNLLDIAIMQKLLPKLHGSRNKLTKVLPILGGFCLKDNSKIKEEYLDKFVSNNLSEKELESDTNIKYKISFEKICRMYKNAIENGFASYAEA